MSRLKPETSFLNRIVLFFLFILLSLFMAAELTLRITEPEEIIPISTMLPADHSRLIYFVDGPLMYKFKENTTFIDSDNISYTLDRLGTRNSVSSLSPDILIAGDSVTFGLRTGEEQIYSKLLEHDLDQDVMNIAVPGYNIIQTEEKIRKVCNLLDCHLMIVGYAFGNDGGMTQTDIDKRNMDTQKERIILSSSFKNPPYLFSGTISRRLSNSSSFMRKINGIASSIFIRHLRLPMLFEKADKEIEGSIVRLKNYSEEKEMKLVFLLLPPLKNRKEYTYIEEYEYYWIKDRLDAYDIEYIDLVDEGIDFHKFRIDEQDPVHYNPKGHRYIADIILQFLETNTLSTIMKS